MIRAIVLILVFATSLVSHAAEVGVSNGEQASVAKLGWDDPTTRLDGSTFNPSNEVKEHKLYCSGEVVATIPSPTAGFSLSKAEVFGQTYGEHECRLSVVDTNGVESPLSNAIMIPHSKSPPSAPTNFIYIRL